MTETEAPSGTEEISRPTGADYTSDREFVEFPIREETLKGVLELGFRTATPVQAATIDPALAGKDMVVRAKTGTGKTAAFGVPIVERTPDGLRKPYALILEPTRELAQQTAEQLEAIARYRDLGIALVVGGVAMGPQEKAFEEGTEIVVGTPGRVLDHLRRGNLDPSSIELVCLDEADEMLSMGFYEDVTRIIEATSKDRQILLFSATISQDTQRIVQKYLRDPLDVMLSTDADGVDLLTHVVYETTPGLHKARALLYLLDVEDPQSAIIFCNTREDTATVATFLDRQGLDAQLISGELSQARRTAVMNRVKAGEVKFLVATDVAARGIDISDLSHVINYSLPQDAAVYLHRTGRTGRIGKKGTAISLVGGTDLSTRRILETRHGIDFEQRQLPSPDDAVRMRVERQARQIREAMGSLVFESYVPTVKALLERDDGVVLLAAALRAFFQWDRERRAQASDLSTVDAVIEARAAKARRRDEEDADGDDRRKRGRGRSRDDRERGERRERRERRDDDQRSATEPRKKHGDALADLDALLDVEGEPAAGDASDAEKKKRKKRKKRTRKDGDEAVAQTGDEAAGQTAPGIADTDDIDALLDLG